MNALRWKQGGFLLVALLLALWISTATDGELQVVNGFETPLRVEIDGDKELVATSNAISSIPLKRGVHLIRTLRDDGTVLEELPIHIQPIRTHLYNILGVSPLYKEEVVYFDKYSKHDGFKPNTELLVDRNFWAGNVDYLFKEPPNEISLDSRSRSITKSYVDVAPGGWKTGLMAAPSPARLRLARRLVTAGFSEVKDIYLGIAALSLDANTTSADGTPKTVKEMGVADLEALSKANPEDPKLLIAYVSNLPLADAEAPLRAYLSHHPKDPTITAELAHVLASLRRPKESLALYASLPSIDSADIGYEDALIQSGRAEEVYSMEFTTDEDRIFQARVGALLQKPLPDEVTGLLAARCKLYAGISNDMGTLLEGLKDEEKATLKLEWDALHDPSVAWDHYSAVSRWQLQRIHPNTRLLVGLEFWRAGDALLGKALVRGSYPYDDELWLQAMNPDQPLPPKMERFSGTGKAILLFIRSRAEGARGNALAEQELRAAALAMEMVPGVVHLAAPNWPVSY